MTEAKTLHEARMDPVTRSFIDGLAARGGEPIYKLSVEDARTVLEKLQSEPVDKYQVDTEDVTIPAGPSGEVSLRIVRPLEAPSPLPVVMYFHGGGWILGSKNTHDRLIREIAEGTDAAVVFVNYTPSPEAHYPTPIEEAYAATRYIAERGGELGLDGSRIAIAGDSVGGNMVAAVSVLAKQRGAPRIDYQVLFYPVTDAAMDTESYQQFADGPWLTKPAMEWFWDAYAPDRETRKQITASPLTASTEDLAGLPPALVITAENDVLRDEGEAYAHKLMEAGVEVTAVRCIGAIHDFIMLDALAGTSSARSAIGLANALLAAMLSSEEEECPECGRAHI